MKATKRSVVEEVLDLIHRKKSPAERAQDARDRLLEVGRLLGVDGLHARMSLLTIVTRLKDHLEAAGA
jgi:hypothetical protein